MPRQYSKIQYRYTNPSHPVDLHDASYLTPGRSNGRPSSKHIEVKPVEDSRNDITTVGVLYATTFRVHSRHPSTPSTHDVRRRPHFEKSESESGRSVIYIPPETWTEPVQPPQMSIRSFERATDIHIKGTHPRVRCRSETDYMIHAFSRALHQTFLPKRTTADNDWHLYHINYTPSRDGTDYKTYFHSTGPLDTKRLGNIRQLLESYDYGEEPGYECINSLVDEIKSTDIPFKRAMSFKEKNDCLTWLESAARTTCRKLSLLKDRIQIESLVCVCPEEYYVDGVERRPSYNVWVTVDPRL